MTVTPLAIALAVDVAAIQLQTNGGGDYLPPDQNLGFPTTVIGDGSVYTAMQASRQRLLGVPPVNAFTNVLMRIDTSSMAGQSISAAELEIVIGVGFVDPAVRLSAGWNPSGLAWTGGTPTSADAEYVSETDAFDIPNDVLWPGIIVPTTIVIPLLLPDANINRSGYTYLRFHMNVAQPPTGGPGADHDFGFYVFDAVIAKPLIRITHTAAPLPACHVVLGERAPSVAQCPTTAVNTQNVVRCEVRTLNGVRPESVWWRAEMLEPCTLRTTGGVVRSGFTLSSVGEQVGLVAASVSVPPQSALCPENARAAQSDVRVEFRAFGVHVWAVVTDAANSRLETLVGLSAPSGAANALCAVSLDFGFANANRIVQFALTNVARWQGGGGALIGTAPVSVALDANGQGAVSLPPVTALTPGSVVGAWIAREPTWFFTVPDAASCNMSDLVSVP